MAQPRWVTGFDGHTFAITGVVSIDDERTFRDTCVGMALSRGAKEWKSDMSGKVTLLVYGDLASKNVSDKARQYSKKLRKADEFRRSGHDLLVIDGAGFSDLLYGLPARNRELRALSVDEYLVLPQLGESILGGPLALRLPGSHNGARHTSDFNALDRGSVAHEETLGSLERALAERNLIAERPGRLAPKFDLGWTDDCKVYIAEVKSFRDESEVDQVRHGLGQVQDYAQRVRRISGLEQEVVPVLVLEQRPSDAAHWIATTRAAGVELMWGPSFDLQSA